MYSKARFVLLGNINLKKLWTFLTLLCIIEKNKDGGFLNV